MLGPIQADTSLNAIGAGLLTGLPVLLFALATPLATGWIRRFGPETVVVLCLSGVLAGTVIRSTGPAWVVLAGTAVIGVAIALGNIAVPVIIRRDVPWRQVSLATGAYSAAMNVGSMITLVVTAPLAEAVGWRWAIAAWAVVTAGGLAYWLWWSRRLRARASAAPEPGLTDDSPDSSAGTCADGAQDTPTPAGTSATGPAPAPGAVPGPDRGRSRFRLIIVLLTVAFCGQSGAYYATTTWLPTLLSDAMGLAAGASGATASLFQVAAIVGAFGLPVLSLRARRPWVPVAVMGVLWIILPLGLLLAPEAYVLWSIIGGIAQGGGFTAIFSIIARVAITDAQAASGSAWVQTGGYLVATITPPLAGWLNATSGDWTAPLLLVLVLALMFCTGGLLAARLAQRPT
ncbi:MFS transporter [Citricoccus sp. SGAir0253]|uniref:MFS transporter n=1 Tax=Citricoccus sp. SGAir0253 TaxID=2567881 RepID=UPI001FF03932